MTAFALLALQDPVVAQLDRMGTALVVLAIAAVFLGLASLAALIVSVRTMYNASHLLRSVEQQLNRLAPRTEPLIEKLTRLTDDARGVGDTVRRGVNDLMDTVSDLNRSLRAAHTAADERVREFAAVLDVVRTEAEDVLLDTAATARGIHATAEALRRASPAGHPRRAAAPAADDELDDELDEEMEDELDEARGPLPEPAPDTVP